MIDCPHCDDVVPDREELADHVSDEHDALDAALGLAE